MGEELMQLELSHGSDLRPVLDVWWGLSIGGYPPPPIWKCVGMLLAVSRIEGIDSVGRAPDDRHPAKGGIFLPIQESSIHVPTCSSLRNNLQQHLARYLFAPHDLGKCLAHCRVLIIDRLSD